MLQTHMWIQVRHTYIYANGFKECSTNVLVTSELHAVVRFLNNVIDCCRNHNFFGVYVLHIIFILVSTKEFLWWNTVDSHYLATHLAHELNVMDHITSLVLKMGMHFYVVFEWEVLYDPIFSFLLVAQVESKFNSKRKSTTTSNETKQSSGLMR